MAEGKHEKQSFIIYNKIINATSNNNMFNSLFLWKNKKMFVIDKGMLFSQVKIIIHENILHKWSKAKYKTKSN